MYYGDPKKNHYTKAFKYYLPSKYIAKKFNIDTKEAEKNWWIVFNSWEDTKDKNYHNRQRTFERGFTCRFVYYIIKSFELIILLMVIFIILHFFSDKFDHFSYVISSFNIILKISILFLCVIIYIFLRLSNNTNINKLNGVWKRFAEINQNHIKWIDNNIRSLEDFKRISKR